jgi:hypothetical protein
MRITNIRFAQKVNLGSDESIEFEAEAVIAEDDSIDASTKQLAEYVVWNAQKPIRDGKARQYRAVLADPQAPAPKQAEAKKWLEMYEARKAAVEAL